MDDIVTHADIVAFIEKASAKGIGIHPHDFVKYDDTWTLDGMHPMEWLDAMTMD